MKYFQNKIKMNKLKSEVLHEINERTMELSLIIRKSAQLNDNDINKFLLTAIYANWEAFLRNSISYYIDYLTRYDKLKDLQFISLIIKYEGIFNRNLSDQNEIQNVLKRINEIKLNPSFNIDNIKFKIMNFDNVNKLLKQFNFPEFDLSARVDLNTFVQHRNWVAHGRQNVSLNDITVDKIRLYVDLIENLMDEFLLNMDLLD